MVQVLQVESVEVRVQDSAYLYLGAPYSYCSSITSKTTMMMNFSSKRNIKLHRLGISRYAIIFHKHWKTT